MADTEQRGSPHATFHPGLEGLRGVAVLAVLLFHAEVGWARGGFLGVSSFFTLSGFLITGILLAEHRRTGRIALGRFWARRVRRLMPAGLLTLLAVAIGGAFLADPSQQDRLRGDVLSALAYVANWWLIATRADYVGQLGSPPLTQHFWSLAIEEQYYLAYPLLVLGLLRIGGRRAVVLALAAASLASWGWMAWLNQTDAATVRLYYGTDTRCAELFAGGLLAAIGAGSAAPGRQRRMTAVAGVAGLALTALFFATARVDSFRLYAGGFTLFTLASVCVIAAAVQPGGPVRAVLSIGWLRWVGRVSYGTYLYHWPIFLWLDADRVGLDGFALTACRIGVTLGLAGLSYRYLEEPIRTRRRLVEPGSGSLLPAAMAAVITATWGLSPPSADLLRFEAPARSLADRSESAPPTVLVTGDSIAWIIGEGLRAWGEPAGKLVVENRTFPACGLARGAWIEETRSTEHCDRWPSQSSADLERIRPDVVLVTTPVQDLQERLPPGADAPVKPGDPVFDRWLLSEFAEAVRLFESYGARVVWLTALCVTPTGQQPTDTFDPVRPPLVNDRVLRRLAAALPNVELLDLYSQVCPDGVVTDRLHGIDPFRGDGIHFSQEGAGWVAEWLGPRLIAARRERD